MSDSKNPEVANMPNQKFLLKKLAEIRRRAPRYRSEVPAEKPDWVTESEKKIRILQYPVSKWERRDAIRRERIIMEIEKEFSDVELTIRFKPWKEALAQMEALERKYAKKA